MSFVLGSWCLAGKVPRACHWLGEFLQCRTAPALWTHSLYAASIQELCWPSTLQLKQGKGSGTEKGIKSARLELGSTTIDTIFFVLYHLLVQAATGGHKERSTYPSQCRDKVEKFSAQKRLKVPAACTGTCLPPATSSSSPPHNTASSQRPSGSWVIPVMEESTAQMNATEAENKEY